MFIIEKPYVSEFLVDTIIQHDWAVLDNQAIEAAGMEEGAFRLWSSEKAKNNYLMQEYPLIYANSENAISWVLENLPKSNLSGYINLFKDKFAFRELLKELYPNFKYNLYEYDALKTINAKDLQFPLVIKPTVGFLSFGVHIVKGAGEWNLALKEINREMQIAKSLYPQEVVNSSKFMTEDLIEGQEFAIDAYYDRNGMPVILNIYQHLFRDESDVRDRLYVMSASIMVHYMAKFAQLLRNIGDLTPIRNFPLHMELRVTPDGEIIPIEVNPMRFAGWCTTDVTKYAWGINVYECFNSQIYPAWNDILASAGKETYYFSMAEVPTDIPKDQINSFDYAKFLANYSNILELRRIDFKKHPLFAIIFGSTEDEKELKRITELNTKDYIL